MTEDVLSLRSIQTVEEGNEQAFTLETGGPTRYLHCLLPGGGRSVVQAVQPFDALTMTGSDIRSS